jgi:hypothetical protein
MERFIAKFKERKSQPDLSISDSARLVLKTLAEKPNPNLAEFPFAGIGKGNEITEIVTTEEYDTIFKSGIRKEKGKLTTAVDNGQIIMLFIKLIESGDLNNLLLLGHIHPSGKAILCGIEYEVRPNDSLLQPSMGSPAQGGPSFGGDVGYIKYMITKDPKHTIPYTGILAVTKTGPKIRAYSSLELINIKRYNDIVRVPQITIDL